MNRIWELTGRVAYWMVWPLLWVYLRLRGTRTRVLILAEGQILLVKSWLGSGKWMLPGGGLHVMEDPVECALREVAEETNIRLKAHQLKFVSEGWAAQNGLRFKFKAYMCKLPKTIKPTKQRLELTDVRWFPLSEISQRTDISPDMKPILQAWHRSR